MFFFVKNEHVFAITEKADIFTPHYCIEINKDNEFLEMFRDAERNNLPFIETYENVKTEYHTQTNDEFNEMFKKFSSFYGNENVYQKACVLWGDKEETDTLVLSQRMMKRFEKYECTLSYYIINPPLLGNEKTLIQGVYTLKSISAELSEELLKSSNALKSTINLYAEMRMWYPVHKDLQCLLDQLEDYRNALREFVDDIVRLPIKYYNYGSTYQQ